MQLQQSGLLNRWYSENFGKDSCRGQQTNQVDPVHMSDVFFLFTYILAGGLALSTALFICEITFGYWSGASLYLESSQDRYSLVSWIWKKEGDICCHTYSYLGETKYTLMHTSLCPRAGFHLYAVIIKRVMCMNFRRSNKLKLFSEDMQDTNIYWNAVIRIETTSPKLYVDTLTLMDKSGGELKLSTIFTELRKVWLNN